MTIPAESRALLAASAQQQVGCTLDDVLTAAIVQYAAHYRRETSTVSPKATPPVPDHRPHELTVDAEHTLARGTDALSDQLDNA